MMKMQRKKRRRIPLFYLFLFGQIADFSYICITKSDRYEPCSDTRHAYGIDVEGH